MSLPMTYSTMAERLSDARSWAGDVVDGNRCAFVVGVALKIRPEQDQLNVHKLGSGRENVRNMPFVKKFFVKAQDLADSVRKTYGPPDISTEGAQLLPLVKDAKSELPFDGKKGVIYLQDCWSTPREKVANWFGSEKRTGDHIDLWDGELAEIYRSKGRDAFVLGLLVNAKKISFWRAKCCTEAAAQSNGKSVGPLRPKTS